MYTFRFMILRERAMQPEDIPECVEILANHPVVGPRYGKAIENLPDALNQLLESEAQTTTVMFSDTSATAPICWIGISVFVRDDFLDDLKKPPHWWIGAELTRRIVRGQSPLLSGKELREANSRGGLNLVCWEGSTRRGCEVNGEWLRFMMSTFIEKHRGYLWKEIIGAQPESMDYLLLALNTGGRFWDPLRGGYTPSMRETPTDILRRPHVLGVSRDMDRGELMGSWAGVLFDYHPPVFGLSESEQRLLVSALTGVTDEQLAETHGISLSAIKKRWISIHRRVQDAKPDLTSTDAPASGRGKEKRRRLLAYVRDHPEELRPVSHKLLGEGVRAGRVPAR